MTRDDEYLMHHGIKGMKWGIRKDRGSSSGGRNRRKKNKINPFLNKISGHYRRSHMTDEELDRRIARLSKEKKLKDLERGVEDDAITVGRDVTKEYSKRILTSAAVAATTGAVAYAYNKKYPQSSNGMAIPPQVAAVAQAFEDFKKNMAPKKK